ncbi:MAG TPA: CoA transferase [Terriglobales bacterium]|jgi:crotonobetainyl-CoA:carnitine CoA-transferase CaiB-like acyl-CoA transferase|nr:CoA transferase [Terriglobales bacterium]
MLPLMLDLTRLVPGPLAVQMLQRLGFRTMRISAPGGDMLQQVAPEIYQALQAGKESRTLDLKTSAGREQLLQLVREAAVLIESNLPGAMERLGVGPDVLRAAQPKLVYVRMAGFHEEEWKQSPGHDLTYLAAAGLLRRLEPVWRNVQLADLCGAFWTAMAALDGLRRGGGFYEVYLGEAAQTVSLPTPPFLDGSACCYGIYAAVGGQVALAALEPHLWQRFCSAAGQEEWAAAAMSPAKKENPAYVEICQFFAARTPEEWEQWAGENRIPLRAVKSEQQALAGAPWKMS